MKKQMIIIFTLILSLAFILPVDTAMAAPLNWVELDDFDSYNCDDTYGVNGELSWEVVSGDGDITGDCDVGGDKYLKVVGVGANLAYFNTTSYHTGYYVKMGGGSRSSVVYWYNDTGEPMIKFVRDGGVFRYYSSTGVESMSYSGTAKYLSWQWYTENVIQYKLYDEDFDVLCTYNDTCLISGLESYDDETYKSNTMSLSFSTACDHYADLYEYGYIDEDIESPTDLPEVTGALVTMNGVVGVRDTILYRSNIFTVLTLGDTGRHAVIEITDPNDDIVYSSEMGVSKYILKSFHTLGIYTFRIYDYNYPTTGYDASSTFNVTISGHMTSYINQSGENFTRFYTDGSDCYYNDGEYPKIIFNISSDHKTEEGDFLLLRISKYTPSKTGSSLTTVTEKTYYNKFDQVVFDELRQTYLDGDSTYYAHMYIGYNTLWNVSWGPMQTWIATRGPDLVIASDVVEVCNWPTDENGTHVPPDEWDGGGGAGVELFPTLNDTLGGIVGLIVTMFLTLSPLIVAGAFNNQMGSNIQIPPLVYGITGALGVTISTIFGWFPSWSIFFIIGVGILIIAIVYFIGQRSES